MEAVLTGRALGRATLARQHLLRRAGMDVPAMVEHLVGLQAQTTHSWYAGLWNRLEDFDPVATGAMLTDRTLVRLTVMRGTVHLLTAREALAIRAAVQPAVERVGLGAYRRRLAGVDLDALAGQVQAVLDGGQLTSREIGRALLARYPDSDAEALGVAARVVAPLTQAPPRGVWGRSGSARFDHATAWLREPTRAVSLRDLVARYLAAFGPAGVADVQAWCGLTRLREVVEEMDLVRFRDEGGKLLYDLPDAPRPDPETPAPVRLMYDYDNLFLSHADRSRVVVPDAPMAAFMAGNQQPKLVLADGMTAGDWRTTRAGGTTTLTLHQWRPWPRDVVAEAVAEGGRLLAFLAPGDRHEVVLRHGTAMDG